MTDKEKVKILENFMKWMNEKEIKNILVRDRDGWLGERWVCKIQDTEVINDNIYKCMEEANRLAEAECDKYMESIKFNH